MLTKNRYLVKSYAKRPMTINKNNISHFFYLQKIDNSILIEMYVFACKSWKWHISPQK